MQSLVITDKTDYKLLDDRGNVTPLTLTEQQKKLLELASTWNEVKTILNIK